MFKNISKFAVVAVAAATLPGIAHAGTATDTGTAVLNVIKQCEVNGIDVHLGTFTASQTWNDVGTELGKYDGTTFTAGSRGFTYLTFGSITCDKDIPYKLTITGGGTNGSIKISHNDKVAAFLPAIKQLGGDDVLDNTTAYVGTGAQVSQIALAGKGSGSAQTLVGNVTLDLAAAGSTVVAGESLGVTGTASDTLTYSLNF